MANARFFTCECFKGDQSRDRAMGDAVFRVGDSCYCFCPQVLADQESGSSSDVEDSSVKSLGYSIRFIGIGDYCRCGNSFFVR